MKRFFVEFQIPMQIPGLGQMARRDVLNAVIEDVEHIKFKINDISRIQESVKEIQKNLEDIKKEIKKK